MNVDDFREMYLAELQELRSVEDQLVEAIPKMVEKADNPELRQALEDHLEETRDQRDRLDDLLRSHSAAPREHTDSSMKAIIAEAERWIGMVDGGDLRDAGLIASAQRVEHYEIAVYGTLVNWAKQQGLESDVQVLDALLEQEKSADAKLSAIADTAVNPEAVA